MPSEHHRPSPSFTTGQSPSSPLLLTPSDLTTYAYNILRCVSSILPLRCRSDPSALAHISLPLRTVHAFLSLDVTKHQRALDWCTARFNDVKVSKTGWVSEGIVKAFWETDSVRGKKVEGLWERLLGRGRGTGQAKVVGKGGRKRHLDIDEQCIEGARKRLMQGGAGN